MDKELEQLKQHLCDLGYEDVVVFDDTLGFSYAGAYIGMSDDGRAVYSYDRMIEWLMTTQDWTYEESVEWIDFNTIRALPYAGGRGPIVVYDDPEYMWKDTDTE